MGSPHSGQLSLLVQNVVDDHVAEDGELHVQPAGEEDGQLGVAPGSDLGVQAGAALHLFNRLFLADKGFKGGDVLNGRVVLPELLEFLPERLGGLGHVEVAVLAEVEDVVVVFAGDDVGVSLPLTLQPCSWLSALWLCLRLSLLQPP